MADWRPQDLIVSRLAREVGNGGIVVMGTFTPLAYAAYMLAKLSHAPDSYLIGFNALDISAVRLSMTGAEASAYASAKGYLTYHQCTEAVHMAGRGSVECISPAQIDGDAAFNITCIGDYSAPRVRLPGGAGAPEVAEHYRSLVFYAGRHDKRTLVELVDFRTGRRSGGAQRPDRAYRAILVTPLAVLVKEAPEAPFRIESLHPGVRLSDVIEHTGFALEVPDMLAETERPTGQQLGLIRRIDPFDTISFDFLNSRERRLFLRETLKAELDLVLGAGPGSGA